MRRLLLFCFSWALVGAATLVTAGFFVFAGAGVSWAELKNVPMRVKRISVVSFFVGVAFLIKLLTIPERLIDTVFYAVLMFTGSSLGFRSWRIRSENK